MPRRYRPPKREIEPDVRYNSVMVARLINKLMKGGKKSVAARVVYGALDIIEERAKRPPLEVMEEAMRNLSPVLEVKPRRVGGSTYQIPVEVPPARRHSLAVRWLFPDLYQGSLASLPPRVPTFSNGLTMLLATRSSAMDLIRN